MRKAIVAIYLSTKFHTVNGKQDVIYYTTDNADELVNIVKCASSNELFERIEFEFEDEESEAELMRD